MSTIGKFVKFTGGGNSSRFSKRVIALIAVGLASALMTASARTMSVTVNRDANGVPTSFDFTFEDVGASTTNALWMACGSSDGGASSFDGWTAFHYVAQIPGDTTSLADVQPPSDWGQFSHMRFFLTASDIAEGVMLEYIGATGTQYVMTDFKPTGASAVEMEFEFTDTNPNQALFCARADYNKNSFTFFLYTDGGRYCWRWDYDNGQNKSVTQTFNKLRHALRADSSGITIDGVLVEGTQPAAASSFVAGGNLVLFATHTNGSNFGNTAKVKLYSFKAWSDGSDDSSLVLDLVPCRKSDGTACLYNKHDGAYLTNTGSGSFTKGDEVVSPGTEIVAASELVSAPVTGWMTTTGTFYPYVTPLYVVDVASGSSSISESEFKKVDVAGSSTTTDVSYAEFVGETRTGTIIKRGGGTLTLDRDISSFTGPVHVEEGVAIGTCSNCFGLTSSSASANQRTYVHSGATLVMDAVNNKPSSPETNAVYFEGDGYPGLGGAFVLRNGNTASGTSYWQLGRGSKPVGPSSLFFDIPDKGIAGVTYSPNNNFALDGKDLLIYGRTAGSKFVLNASAIDSIGNLVVSNMALAVSGNSGRLYPKTEYVSTIRFCGGARWHWNTYDNNVLVQLKQTARVYIDDMEYACFDTATWANVDNYQYGVNPWGAPGGNGTTNNWYCGPVVLNDDFRLYNYYSPLRRTSDKRRVGFTLSSKVSGPKGFRPWINSNGVSWGDGMRINLLYPTNTFEGGIVLDNSSLGVWAERAVPSQEGAGLVSITNGYVYFGRYGDGRAASTRKWVEFTMPVTEFVGSGAVTNGTGTWKGLVKKGEGTLDYNSQLGGEYLDLQEGTVKFNTQYRDNYTGEYATYAPDGYEAALPAFTTLKGLAGVLDLEDVGGAYTVANVEDYPSVTNGSLTVTGTWTVDAATLGTGTANIDGTLTFGEGATLAVSGDLDNVARPSGGFLIAKATSISGLPSFRHTGWKLQNSGGELRLVKPGLIITIR